MTATLSVAVSVLGCGIPLTTRKDGRGKTNTMWLLQIPSRISVLVNKMYLCVGKRKDFLDKGLNTEHLQTQTVMSFSFLKFGHGCQSIMVVRYVLCVENLEAFSVWEECYGAQMFFPISSSTPAQAGLLSASLISPSPYFSLLFCYFPPQCYIRQPDTWHVSYSDH